MTRDVLAILNDKTNFDLSRMIGERVSTMQTA